jgi:3',5'-cyclic AMP phosphodiesterase CpdA
MRAAPNLARAHNGAASRGARRAAALLLAVTALAGCGGSDGAPAASPGSTRAATLVDRDGDGFLEPGPGEPLRERRELGAPAGRPGRTLATFAQLTDTHVRDEESPARVPFLDRLGGPFTSTFRPQEAFSAQVLDATVRAVNRERPQAVVVTGDIVDSAQENELEAALAVLDGARVDPGSGARGYDGVQAAGNPDPLFYRPDNDAPRHPGVLAAAQRPFAAAGLDAPWYPALGNHDVLVQGELPPTPAIEAYTVGGRMVTALDPGLRAEDLGIAPDPGSPDLPSTPQTSQLVDALLADRGFGRGASVPADPERRHLAATEVVDRLARAAGVTPAVAGRLDYAFDIGPHVRAIVLDTVNRAGGSRGVVAPDQVEWLRAELARAGGRWVLVFSHNPLEASDGGSAALAALDAAPRVVAAIAGNRHRNTIRPRGATGAPPRGGPTAAVGYWLIGTSSLADWPQQARAFRLREARGGVVLETWMVDHDGRGLAAPARELAYLDAQGGRPQGFAGTAADRNARLYVPGP